MKEFTVKMREFYTADLSLVDVNTIDDKHHLSVRLEDGKILVLEYLPSNDPAWCFYLEENMEDYYESIRKVEWIMEEISKEEKETIEDIIEDTTEKIPV
jgi:hypothetical protein